MSSLFLLLIQWLILESVVGDEAFYYLLRSDYYYVSSTTVFGAIEKDPGYLCINRGYKTLLGCLAITLISSLKLMY
jgi:uncharacterized membrane protein